MYVCMYVCVCVGAYGCVYACVCLCVRAEKVCPDLLLFFVFPAKHLLQLLKQTRCKFSLHENVLPPNPFYPTPSPVRVSRRSDHDTDLTTTDLSLFFTPPFFFSHIEIINRSANFVRTHSMPTQFIKDAHSNRKVNSLISFEIANKNANH